MKTRKNTMNWLCNQQEIIGLVKAIGARNITVVKAVYGSPDKEEEIQSYDKMIMYDSADADRKLLKWCKKLVELKLGQDPEGRYIYFRVIRWN